MKDGNTNGRNMTELVNFRIHKSDVKTLRAVAKAKGVSMSALIRQALVAEVVKQKKRLAR